MGQARNAPYLTPLPFLNEHRQEIVAARPQACTITIECISPSNATVATQAFTFATDGGISQQMIEAKRKGFKGHQSVDSSTTHLSGTPIATVMDTFSCIVYSSDPSP